MKPKTIYYNYGYVDTYIEIYKHMYYILCTEINRAAVLKFFLAGASGNFFYRINTFFLTFIDF